MEREGFGFLAFEAQPFCVAGALGLWMFRV